MPTPLTDAIEALTRYANETTGASDTTLSEAVNTLVEGYGQGGDPYELARQIANGTITEYIDPSFTGTIRSGAFQNCYDLQAFQAHGATGLRSGAFRSDSTIRYKLDLAFPNVTSIGGYQCQNWNMMQSLDLTKCTSIARSFEGCSNFTILILRKSDAIVTLTHQGAFYNTPFITATGGTIYIPKALYDHLGDGTSLDYQNATNWSTVHGWGHTTWAQIEGSYYETHYADGTPIE